VRRAVHRATIGFDVLEVLGLADVLRALKHHMLEEVCEARAAFDFVARADIVIDSNRDDRRGVIFRQYHAQTIVELKLREGNFERLRSNRRQAKQRIKEEYD